MADETIVPATKTGEEHSQENKVIRTPEEIAKYNLNKKAEEARALGLNPGEILNIKPDENEIPAWYKEEKAKEAQKSSLQMAETISDPELRDKVKVILGRVTPSDNPEEDFRLALGAASASKNKQVLSEMDRYSRPRVTAAGGSAPVNFEEEFVPTEEEAAFMKPPYNLTKEQIISKRPK